MAGRDYLRCSNCKGKAVYDANWYHQVEARNAVVAALCYTCRYTHTLEVVAKEAPLDVTGPKSPITGHECLLGPECDLYHRTRHASITCALT